MHLETQEVSFLKASLDSLTFEKKEFRNKLARQDQNVAVSELHADVCRNWRTRQGVSLAMKRSVFLHVRAFCLC
jgi:hypothetical protein